MNIWNTKMKFKGIWMPLFSIVRRQVHLNKCQTKLSD